MKQMRDNGWGVPPPHPFAPQGYAREQAGSGFPLYSSAGLPACGVPLRSVTRNAVFVHVLRIIFLLSITVSVMNASGQPTPKNQKKIKKADMSSIVVLPYDTNDYWLFEGRCLNADLSVSDVNTIDRLVRECIDEYMQGRSRRSPDAVSRRGYNLQLVAVINPHGEKEVWVNGLCKRAKHNWRSDIVLVMDGGNCYYKLRINLTKGTFYGFGINGIA